MLGLIVVSTTLLLCFVSDSSSSNRMLSAAIARDTSLSVVVVGRETRRLNEQTNEWENGYFLTFDALDKIKIINDGELKVPRSTFVRTQREQKGMLSVDKDGRFKSFTLVRNPPYAA